jgi:hypothetical protein
MKIRDMLKWYERICHEEQKQYDLEEELSNFPSEGDGY